jgi:hypothetical protein
MNWLVYRINELTGLPEVDVLFAMDRMLAGKSLGRTAPYDEVGYDIRDLNHVPRRLQKADEKRRLVRKLWRELHRRWADFATIMSSDILGPLSKIEASLSKQQKTAIKQPNEQVRLKARGTAFLGDPVAETGKLPTLKEVRKVFPGELEESDTTFYRKNPWYKQIRLALRKSYMGDTPNAGFRTKTDDDDVGKVDAYMKAPKLRSEQED